MKKGKQGEGGGVKKGYKQSAKHKANIKKAQQGKNNSNYKHGNRIDYRKKIGAKTNELIHHSDGNRQNNSPSNLVRLKRKPKAKTSSTHEKLTKRNQGRPKGS